MKRRWRKGMQLPSSIQDSTTRETAGQLVCWCDNVLTPSGPISIVTSLAVSAVVVIGTMIYVFAVLPARAVRRWGSRIF